MTGSREGFTVRVLRSGSAAPAGVGFVVDEAHIVTCSHVVNAALGRDPRAQDWPGPMARVQVEFPMLGGSSGAPSRSCAVQAWVPPPSSGISGGDVAGLVVAGDELPGRALAARLAGSGEFRDAEAWVFGYPGDPPRPVTGAWAVVRLRGVVGGGVVQLDAASESVFRTQPGYSGSPVIVTGQAGGDAVVGMLAAASVGGAGDAYAIPVAELAQAWPDVVGRLTVPACPYRGLGAFTAGDADVFVGREDDVAQLREMVNGRALVVVTGPSGVGKSSLIDAGLIPRLQNDGWAAGSFRLAGIPVNAAARALAAVQTPDRAPTAPEVGEWAALIRSSGLDGAGARLALALGRPVVLHADQLEEILDPAACLPEERAEFLELLLSARAAAGEGLHLVGTLRADFWAQLLEHPDAGTRLSGGWFGLSPMGRYRLERVISEPARARSVRYQPGLAAVIAGDADGGRGLPLLEFALTQLWPHQQGREITLAAYQAVGGVTGALSGHAEQAYRELAKQFPQERIRRVLLALVRSRGGATDATRRVASRNRLGGDWEVAQALAGHRLVTVSRDDRAGTETAEIAHEALIREWPALASWVNADAEFQHWLTTAEERAADGELLPDTRLAEADRWLAERAEDIPPEVSQLIQDSKSEWRRRVTELEETRNRAEARRLAAAAELALTTHGTSLQVPVILAIEALKTAPVLEADTAIRHAIRTAARPITRADHDGPVLAVAFSPDGARIATASSDRSARVIDAATGTEIWRLDHDEPVNAVVFSPDGARIATTATTDSRRGTTGSARVFDAATGTQIWRLDHDAPVNAVVFSPDGARIATASSDSIDSGSARVIDAATGTEIWRLGHDDPVNAVAFSPDGALIATVTGSWYGKRGSARVIDAATGTEIWRLDHDDPVNAVVFSPDGARIAIATTFDGRRGERGSARVIDVAAGTEIWRLDHNQPVNAVAFSPDGARIATASVDRSVRVIDAAMGSQIWRLDHDGPVLAVVFSPDGARIATATAFGSRGGERGSARVIDAAMGSQIWRLEHDGPVLAVAFSPDGARIATASVDRSARVIDAATGTEIWRLDHNRPVLAVAFSPDGARIATGTAIGGWDRGRGGMGERGETGSARVIDAETGTEIWRLDHDGSVNAVAFSPDGARIATAAGSRFLNSNRARVFDAATGTEIWRLDHYGPVFAVAFSPDGARIATGTAIGSWYGERGRVHVFDAATGAEVWRLDHDRPVKAVTFSPDGARIATTSSGSIDGNRARVFDAATGAEIWRLDHDRPVKAVAFSPDGARIAATSVDCSARVFDAATGAEIWRLDHDRPVKAVAFSPDGARIATTSSGSIDGNRARVFDAATGAEIWSLNYDGAVDAVAFSPDGARIAIATGTWYDKRGSARMFDAATGAEISRLDHDDLVNAVAFSPDGARIATVSSDCSARVWYADHSHLIEQAMGRLTRNLDRQEWDRYFLGEPYRKTREDLP